MSYIMQVDRQSQLISLIDPHQSMDWVVIIGGGTDLYNALGTGCRFMTISQLDHGVTIAQFSNFRRVTIAYTRVSDLDTLSRIGAYHASMHGYNQPFYDAAKTRGAFYTHLANPGSDGYSPKRAEEFDRPSTVDLKTMAHFLNAGYRLVLVSNDRRVADLLNDSKLDDATMALNNKNSLYRLMTKHGLSLRYPEATLIHDVNPQEVADLLQNSDDKIVSAFLNWLIERHQVPARRIESNAFIKMAIGVSGNAVNVCILRSVDPSPADVRGFLQNLQKRCKNGLCTDFQVLEAIDAAQPPSHPLNDDPYYSACMTLRITQHGDVRICQVADQVLSGGISYAGNYWNRTKERLFISEVGEGAIKALGIAIRREGYYGYFGTDFLRNSDGKHECVVDGNARMNGNDLIIGLARRALETAGFPPDSAFGGAVWTDETSDAALPKALHMKFGKFRFNPETGVGLVLQSKLRHDVHAADVLSDKVAFKRLFLATFINPTRNPDLFCEFYKLTQAK